MEICKNCGQTEFAVSEEKMECIHCHESYSSDNALLSTLKRAYMFLEDKDYESAGKYFEKALDNDPECAAAYLGKMLSGYKCSCEEQLSDIGIDFNENLFFQRAIKHGSEFMSVKLNEYSSKSIYNLAVKKMESACSSEEINYSLELFSKISDKIDCHENLEKCAKKIDEFKRLQMEAEDQEHLRREEKKKRNKKTAKIAAISAGALILITGGIILSDRVIIPKIEYSNAQKILEQGNYDEAVAAAREIKYIDCSEFIDSCYIEKANALYEEKEYSDAIDTIRCTGGYDYAEFEDKCRFSIAEELFANGKYDDAIYEAEKITQIDTEKLIKSCKYGKAEELFNIGDYDSSIELLSEICGFEDSSQMLVYVKAESAVSKKEYREAIKLYQSDLSYKDCEEKSTKYLDQLYSNVKEYFDSKKYYKITSDLDFLVEQNYKDSSTMKDTILKFIDDISGTYNFDESLSDDDTFNEYVKSIYIKCDYEKGTMTLKYNASYPSYLIDDFVYDDQGHTRTFDLNGRLSFTANDSYYSLLKWKYKFQGNTITVDDISGNKKVFTKR